MRDFIMKKWHIVSICVLVLLFLIVKPHYDIYSQTYKKKNEVQNLIEQKSKLELFVKILGIPKYNYNSLDQLPEWEKSFLPDPKGNNIVIFYYEGLPYFRVTLEYKVNGELIKGIIK